MNNSAVAALIHRIPALQLAAAVPHLRPFNDVNYEIRQDFAAWTVASRTGFASWQAAWNAWTGAGPQRPGRVRLTIRCPECHGRLISTRRGVPELCRRCVGRRRVTINEVALWQPPPPAAERE